jgi:hypothetical protein
VPIVSIYEDRTTGRVLSIGLDLEVSFGFWRDGLSFETPALPRLASRRPPICALLKDLTAGVRPARGFAALKGRNGIREEKADKGCEGFQVLRLDNDVETLRIAAEGREIEVACRGDSVDRRVVPKLETGSLDDGHISTTKCACR